MEALSRARRKVKPLIKKPMKPSKKLLPLLLWQGQSRRYICQYLQISDDELNNLLRNRQNDFLLTDHFQDRLIEVI